MQGRWDYSFGDARGPRACPPLMPQGLDVTVWTIRPAFGLVKPKAQDIWPPMPFTPNMLVDYLWISLVRTWAQGGQGLGESGQNEAYWTESRRASRRVSVERSFSVPGESVEKDLSTEPLRLALLDSVQ